MLWIPIFQVLETAGFEVYLVNARHAKNVPGRKTDVSDCQWLQYLHSVGLLQASFRPPDEVCALRTLMRQRAMLVAQGAEHIQHMQKSLSQMNLHLHHVIRDLAGVTGLAIVDAILTGERDPQVLAQLRDPRVRASEETVRQALVGDYRPEHVFTLRQARAAYVYCQGQLQECDAEIEGQLAQLRARGEPAALPAPPVDRPPRPARKNELVLRERDLATECQRILGVDATQIPGFQSYRVCQLIAELGPDLSAFPSAGHFASWQGICPNPEESGGRVLKRGTRGVKHRVGTLFRLAAFSLAHSHGPLGDYYRRMRAKLGPPQGVTATAHKLARIYYHVVTTQQPYDESLLIRQEEQHRRRRLARLQREAAALGFELSAAAA